MATEEQIKKLWSRKKYSRSIKENWALVVNPCRNLSLGMIIYIDENGWFRDRKENHAERTAYVKQRAAEGSRFHRNALASSIALRMLE